MSNMPTAYTDLFTAAKTQQQPLYLFGARINQKDPYPPSIWLTGVLVAAAYSSQKIRNWIQIALSPASAASSSKPPNPAAAWEQRNTTAVVPPGDGVHTNMTLSPNVTSLTNANGKPVIPLILHQENGTAEYPVCADDKAVLEQLPEFEKFFQQHDINDAEHRLQYAAEDPDWTLHCSVTTATVNHTTFVTNITDIRK
ncbi:hypothetical protein PLESTB_001701100 [Pleodorina starrii]|uniref:Uncharacterized protein n=1 Tax=Pleodorina starrii TaxID=330485 RepID=A0A9W6BZ73_9CHLO|nr:hypothetical protein PLESTB_001701100 [Pleodorina starrii]